MAKPIEGFLTKYQSDEVLIPFIDDLEQLLMHIWSNSLLKRMITEESPQLKSKLLIQKSTRCTRTLILVLLHMSGCKGSEKDKMDFAMEAKKALVFFVDRINAKSPLLLTVILQNTIFGNYGMYITTSSAIILICSMCNTDIMYHTTILSPDLKFQSGDNIW